MTKASNLYPSGSLSEADLNRDIAKQTMTKTKSEILEIKDANKWLEQAKLKPIPQKLVDCLWYQGELSIMFADTNLGKSIFAVQIANALTTGTSIPPFIHCETKLNVLYCDFEMSDKQFENRYSEDYQNHFNFADTFYRAELNLDKFISNSDKPIEEQISDKIISSIIEQEIDVVIIDNLTYIAREIEKSKSIAPLMQKLKSITKQYNLSIMVLAHTPKRDMTKPLTNSDISGSKFLSNFADSIIAIGKSSKDERLRYIKQVKSRNSEYVYHSENIALFQIKKDVNFLGYHFKGYSDEMEHLEFRTKKDMEEMDMQILEIHQSEPKLSLQIIADKVGTNKMRVKRVIDRSKAS